MGYLGIFGLNGIAKKKTFNSLYGILKEYYLLMSLAMFNFQFPLWDTHLKLL